MWSKERLCLGLRERANIVWLFDGATVGSDREKEPSVGILMVEDIVPGETQRKYPPLRHPRHDRQVHRRERRNYAPTLRLGEGGDYRKPIFAVKKLHQNCGGDARPQNPQHLHPFAPSSRKMSKR